MSFLGLKIHRSEYGLTLLLGGYFFLVVSVHYLLKPARNALFLQRLGADSLPWVYILTALAIWPLVAVYSRLAPGRRLLVVLQATLLFVITNLVLFWVFLPDAGDWLYAVFYVWVKLYAVLLPSQFWLMTNELLDPRQAKRLVGPIGAGGILGGIAGSSVAGTVADVIGTNSLLAAAAGTVGGALWVLTALSRTGWGRKPLREIPTEETDLVGAGASATGGGPEETASGEAKDTEGPADERPQGRRLLHCIGLLLIMTVMVHTLIDWQFNKAAEMYIDSLDARTEFFGFFFATLNVVTLGIQLLVTSAVLRVFGVGIALMLMPATLALGSVAVFAVPTLWTVATLRGADDALRYSLDQSTREVLFLPVPSELRARLKPRIDVIASRVANGAGGLVILAAVWLLDDPFRSISLVCLGLIAIWMWVAFRTRSRYSASLQRVLHVRDVDVDHLIRARLDSNAQTAIRDGLQSDDPETVWTSLGLVERTDPADFSGELARIVGKRSPPEVQAWALRLLNEAGDPVALDRALELIDEADSEVRPEAVAYACSLGDPETREEIEDFLRSTDTELAAAAAVCLLEQEDRDKRAEGIRILREMASRERPAARAGVADVLKGRRSLEGCEGLLRDLLADPEPSVVRAALAAAAQHRAIELVGDICRTATRWQLQAAALRCLQEMDDAAVGPLTGVLADPRNDRRVREFAARALSRIGGDAAVEALLAGIGADDRAVRWSALKAMNHLRRRGQETELGAQRETAVVQREWHDLLELHRLHGRLGPGGLDSPGAFVGTVLEERIGEATERLFRALGLTHSLQPLFFAYRALATGDPEARAHAIELVDNTVEGPMRRPLVDLLEASAPEAKAAIACRELGKRPPADAREALRELMVPDDPWLAACAVRAMDEERIRDLPRGLVADLAATDHPALLELLEEHGLLQDGRPRPQPASKSA